MDRANRLLAAGVEAGEDVETVAVVLALAKIELHEAGIRLCSPPN